MAALSLEEFQEVVDEMRIGKVVNTMTVKKEDASIEEQQEELKGSVLKDLDKSAEAEAKDGAQK